jgi:hypothetical protein
MESSPKGDAMPDLSQIFQSVKEDLPVIAAAWPSLTILAIVLIGGTWWLRGHLAKAQVGGLRSQLDARDERLKLAADKYEKASSEKTELATTLTKLQQQIAASAPIHALASTSASAQHHILRLGQLWDDVGHTIVPTGAHMRPLTYDAPKRTWRPLPENGEEDKKEERQPKK